ncbi:response regulator [Zunongwangia profunda]|uniref:response regulator n=1 Tax=Zunongwangia profunda TaxID=398743 RepID=UPI000C94B174|nr:response regulator [Zunongwangia profunda]MAC64036.1 response regulator [Flavobacteriaceae bacterium]MCC4226729.1 response regulator [Zunongwangia profunda]|tara:strand:- start:728 stop:1387 length:660 start_codon:yes stop_codon:yes gene_type:complete
MRTIKILLIDDHPLILEGYQNVLNRLEIADIKFVIETSDNCDQAWQKIVSENYDVVFLDINFPVAENSRFISGEDLGAEIKKEFGNKIKLVILTVIEDPLRVQNILRNVNPDGFLVKGETNSEELITCLKKVITYPPFYGATISKILQSGVLNPQVIDEIDRQILHQLSLGTKTKDIPLHVHLSLRAVEDRKRRLKEIMDVQQGGNKALLEKARKSGYI